MTFAIESLLEKIVSSLAEAYQPDQVILFGSYAWGTPDEGSDLDLLIVKQTERRPLDRRIEVRTLLSGIPRSVGLDLLVLTPEEVQHRLERHDPFYKEIASKGKKLYERAGFTGLS